MRCPTCQTATTPDINGRERCPRCDGLWLAESQLGPAIRSHRPSQSPTSPPDSSADGITCPHCDTAMVLSNYAHDSGVAINRCHYCRGTWLAGGQLDQLAQYEQGAPAVQRLEAAMAGDIESAGRRRRLRELLRSRVLSGGVAVAYLLFALVVVQDLELTLRLLEFVLLPTACIWFCDGLGRLTGIATSLVHPVVTQTTPGDILAVGGWIALLAPAVTLIFLWI